MGAAGKLARMFTSMATLRFARFSTVGAAGFVVDALVFFAAVNLLHLGWAAARALAFLVAVGVTWQGNRRLTFRSQASPRREAGLYLGVQCAGCLVNYLAFLAAVAVVGSGQWLVLPYLVGTAAGMVFNYTLLRTWVFKP